MRLKLYGFLLILLSLMAAKAQALMAPLPPPTRVEITGQVLQAGKPSSGASVKAYFYNCDTKLQASATSNANGYYHLVIPSYPKLVYFSRPLPPAELLKFKKQYPNRRPRGMRGYSPIPIFLSANPANLLTNPTAHTCQQALKGGIETPPKNRFNLTLAGVPAKAPAPPKTQAPPKPSEQQKCQTQGGKWENLSRGVVGCNLSYKDAGRLCTDGKQCSSQVCLAKDRNPRASEGQCAANTSAIINGCLGEIKRGHWRSRTCP